MNTNKIKRGEIYNVCLDPAFGMELAGFKHRPVIVVSVNSLHDETQVITVVPGTDGTDRAASKNGVVVHPDEVNVYLNSTNPLLKETLFQCHQIRTISHGRFTQRSRGRLPEEVMERIESGVRYCLGLGPE